MPFPDAALLLLGHGSTLNADSSAPTWRHAAEIRRRGVFTEVQVGFWKEEPNFRQALRQTGCAQVYVVPNFISSGYFTEQVIPRELGLSGPVTHIDGQDVFYCDPVGLHASMTEALLRRAREVVAASGEALGDPARTACLFICGHGTSLNDNSTKIIHEQVELIRARGLFADCQGVLMEQKPFVKEWRELTSCPDVIVVPFFIADGLHSYEDIPVLLGLTHNMRERGFSNPHRENNRRLWYASAIGTEPFIADVIIAQAEQFRVRHAVEAPKAAVASLPVIDALQAFQRKQPLPWRLGEVVIEPDLRLHHHADRADDATLQSVASAEELREWGVFDARGEFRPLPAAPSLRQGWIYAAMDWDGLHLALNHLYPAALANALQGPLSPTPWSETAERQTGRFRIVRELDDAAVRDLVAEVCECSCLKRRLWSPAESAKEIKTGEIPLLCPEACNYFVGKARTRLKGGGDD